MKMRHCYVVRSFSLFKTCGALTKLCNWRHSAQWRLQSRRKPARSSRRSSGEHGNSRKHRRLSERKNVQQQSSDQNYSWMFGLVSLVWYIQMSKLSQATVEGSAGFLTFTHVVFCATLTRITFIGTAKKTRSLTGKQTKLYHRLCHAHGGR